MSTVEGRSPMLWRDQASLLHARARAVAEPVNLRLVLADDPRASLRGR